MKTTIRRPEPMSPVRTLPRPLGADAAPFGGWGPRVPGI